METKITITMINNMTPMVIKEEGRTETAEETPKRDSNYTKRKEEIDNKTEVKVSKDREVKSNNYMCKRNLQSCSQ